MSSRNEMCFDVKSFKADTAHLGGAEVGAYLLLLFEMHLSLDGWIEEGEMQRVSRVPNAHWKRVRAVLDKFLIVRSDGRVSQKRIQRDKMANSQGTPSRCSLDENASAYIESKPLPFLLPSESVISESSLSRSPEKRTLAKQFPQDWKLSLVDIDYARSKGVQDVDELFEAFRDYHIGKATRWTDWSRAWKTWVRNDRAFNHKRGGSNGKRGGSIVDAWDKLSRVVEERENNESGQGALLGLSHGPIR